ncbi:hypothetical protein [Streptomyces buecherae]|uniref:hypothetical protein n=1 Tax=Streptomyces buecherae TaxID=2763006 RepID=UPI001C9B2BAD|nr:hypothetical protein [Streptomyces buecherae]
MSGTGEDIVRARAGEHGVVDRAGGQGPTGTPAPVTAALARAALTAALLGRFEGPLRPPATRTPIAHPNGFVKLPLAQLPGDGRRLFLHVWRAGGEDAQIHDHRWHFAATVLTGELYNTVVEVAPDEAPRGPGEALGVDLDPDAYHVVRYRPQDGGFHLDASDAYRVRVTEARTHTVPAGGQYGMSAYTLHRAGAAPGTLTLVARGRPVRDDNRVLARAPVTGGFRRWRYVDDDTGADERGRYLRAALEALS